ncbi:MAG: hypothetical protein RDV41_04215 [Planctomycetota bacterium]|nr:hypothetical protein [Planctomycetota bacterium]
MSKFAIALLCVVSFAVAVGCESLTGPVVKDPTQPAESGGLSSGGSADWIKDSQAPYKISLHANPAVGQWAEWEASGMKQKWAVVGEQDGKFWVEYQYLVGQDQVVFAYLSDKDGNVTKAYGGLSGKEGVELKIMEKPAGTAEVKGREVSKTAEKVTVKGGSFDTQKIVWEMEYDGKKMETTSWRNDNVYFTKLVKAENMELIGSGTDAKASLKIPAGK